MIPGDISYLNDKMMHPRKMSVTSQMKDYKKWSTSINYGSIWLDQLF